MIVRMLILSEWNRVYAGSVVEAAHYGVPWILGEGRSRTRGERLLVELASLVSSFALHASSKENVRCAVPSLSLIHWGSLWILGS